MHAYELLAKLDKACVDELNREINNYITSYATYDDSAYNLSIMVFKDIERLMHKTKKKDKIL